MLRMVALVALVSSCAASTKPAAAPCKEDGVGGEVENAAKTGFEGAKTGVVTGVEGVKAAGSGVGGLIEGGSDEGKARWKEGKRETKQAAREGAVDTKSRARTPRCQ